MKKSTKQVGLILTLLFGIILKISVLFFMSKNTVPSEYYIFHEWANFFLICIFFSYVFSKIKSHIKQGLFKLLTAFGLSVWSYVAILIEKSIIEYNRFPLEYSKGKGMIAGLLNSFTECARDCSWLYIQFALFTMLLCAFSLCFSRIIGAGQEVSEKYLNKQLTLKIMFILDICIKIAVCFNAKNPFLHIWYFTDLEIINYILDGLIFLFLFALLNRKDEKICYKLIYASVISLIFTGVVIEESLIFLYNRNWLDCFEEGISREHFFAQKLTEHFKSGNINYELVFLSFFALCIAHILMKKYGVLEKLKVSLKKIANHFIIDDSVYEIAFDVEGGKSISGKLKEFSSVKIGDNRITAGLLTYKDGHKDYVCFNNNDNLSDESISICNDESEMFTEYSRRIKEISSNTEE